MGEEIDDDGPPAVPPRRRRRWGTVLSLVMTLVLALSAGAVTTNNADADRTSATKATTTAPPATPTTEPVPQPGQARPAPPGTYTVEVTDCRQTGSDLRIWGTVRNDGGEPATYRVAVTATTAAGEVLLTGYAETEATPPAESRPWKLQTMWADDLVAAGARCTTSGVEVIATGGSA